MLDLLKSRRSIRKFQDRKVQKDKIDAIMNGVLRSPSSRGRRPWEFIIVDDTDKIQQLSQARANSSGFLSGAPLAIVVAADKDIGSIWTEDASIAAVIIQLMAHSLGLGSCWIQIREREHDENETAEGYVRRILGIPEKYGIQCIIAVGYPAEDKRPYADEELPYNKVHYNKF